MLFLSISYVQLRRIAFTTVQKPVKCHSIFISLVDRKNKQNACLTQWRGKEKKYKLFPITRAEMDAGSVIMIIRLWQNVVQLYKEEMCIERRHNMRRLQNTCCHVHRSLVITGTGRCQSSMPNDFHPVRIRCAMAPLTRRCTDHLSFVSAGPTLRLVLGGQEVFFTVHLIFAIGLPRKKLYQFSFYSIYRRLENIIFYYYFSFWGKEYLLWTLGSAYPQFWHFIMIRCTNLIVDIQLIQICF